MANWYRPGASEHNGYTALYSEIAVYYQEVSGIFIAGDMNIHHQKWLRFSNGNSNQGADLKSLCDFHGLIQMVKEPTRNDYLLDLVLTDVPSCSIKILPYIADHKGVMAILPLPEILEFSIEREVWILAKASWKVLKKDLLNQD